MKITVWGCRGSIPVPDAKMISFGGNTTCIEVRAGKSTLIIDAGTGIRKLGHALTRRGCRDITLAISHSHWDHIHGFPFFAPIYSSKTAITVLGCTNAYRHLEDILARQMSYEYFPVSFMDLKSRITFNDACHKPYETDDYRLEFIRNNHPVFTLGMKITDGKKTLVIITDNELMQDKPVTPRDAFTAFCRNADCLMHDAQFTDREYPKRKGWGHSTFEQAMALARDADVKDLRFIHHDPEREDKTLEKIERRFRSIARRQNLGFTPTATRELDRINL